MQNTYIINICSKNIFSSWYLHKQWRIHLSGISLFFNLPLMVVVIGAFIRVGPTSHMSGHLRPSHLQRYLYLFLFFILTVRFGFWPFWGAIIVMMLSRLMQSTRSHHVRSHACLQRSLQNFDSALTHLSLFPFCFSCNYSSTPRALRRFSVDYLFIYYYHYYCTLIWNHYMKRRLRSQMVPSPNMTKLDV